MVDAFPDGVVFEMVWVGIESWWTERAELSRLLLLRFDGKAVFRDEMGEVGVLGIGVSSVLGMRGCSVVG